MARTYNITSTIKATSITTTIYNPETKALETKAINLKKFDNSWTKEKVLKVLRLSDFFAVDYTDITEISALYGMDENTFVKISEEINPDDRRGLITRTLKSYKPKYWVFDSNEPMKGQQVKEAVVCPADFQSWKKEKQESYLRGKMPAGVFFLQLHEEAGMTVEELRGVSPDKFIENAEELDPKTYKPIADTEEATEATEG